MIFLNTRTINRNEKIRRIVYSLTRDISENCLSWARQAKKNHTAFVAFVVHCFAVGSMVAAVHGIKDRPELKFFENCRNKGKLLS